MTGACEQNITVSGWFKENCALSSNNCEEGFSKYYRVININVIGRLH